jgi:hypothetical protein
MPNLLANSLHKAAVLTFEELSFMLPNEDPEDLQLAAPGTIGARISFRGAFTGTLAILICGDLLPRLSTNMLGQETPPDPPQQLDALREVANVICGNLLPEVAGRQAVFDICPPEILTPSDLRTFSDVPPVAETQVGLHEGRVDLFLYLDDPGALAELRT